MCPPLVAVCGFEKAECPPRVAVGSRTLGCLENERAPPRPPVWFLTAGVIVWTIVFPTEVEADLLDCKACCLLVGGGGVSSTL